MFEVFIIQGLLAGIGIALMAGPLGCFIVWRRMAYFGDTLAHSALLGVALSLLLEVNTTVTVLLVSLSLAFILVTLQNQRQLASDTLLGIMSHSTLASGMVLVALLQGWRVDLLSYLFGDILTVSQVDLLWVYTGAAIVLAFLYLFWQKFLAITVHEELAFVEGQPVKLLRMCLMLLIAWVIALSMKIVGILLITSLLIIPPATARRFARTPSLMALFASIIGILSVSLGMLASFELDIPTGPAIVVTAASLFLLSHLKSAR